MTETRVSRRFAVTFALAAALSQAAPAADVAAFAAKRIWPGDGPPIADAVMVVTDGKITAIGPRATTTIPAGATLRDFGAAELIPGLIVAEASLGESARDDARTVTPEQRAIDGFDFFGDHHRLLASGVTAVQISPGTSRLAPGQGAVVKLAGADPAARTLAEVESLRLVLTSASRNPPTLYDPPVGPVSVDRPLDPTKRQAGASLPGAVASLRALFGAVPAELPANPDPVMAAVAPFRQGKKPVRFAATTATEIRAAARLADEFGLQYVLSQPAEIHDVFEAGKISKNFVGAVLSPKRGAGSIENPPIPRRGEPAPADPAKAAAFLIAAGAKVAVTPANDGELRDLLFAAAELAGGSGATTMLKTVTLWPAEMMGVADRVGSLRNGRDADFVVLSGSPDSLRPTVREVFIDGKSEHATKTRKDALVVRGGTLFNGQTTIANGAVSIEGDVIRAAGPDASGPLNAEIVEFPAGSWIVPGFIDLGATLGLGGNPTPVGMNVKLGERLLGTDKAIALAREGGVTTALLAGGDGPAPVVAFKLSDSARAVRDPVAIRMTVRDGSAGSVAGLKSALQSGKTYAESWTKFDAAQVEYEKLKKEYDAAKAKADAAKKPEEKKPDAPASGSGSAPKDAPKEAPKKSFEDDEPSQATEKKEEAKPADAKTATPAAPAVPPEPKAPTKPSVVETLEPYRALFAGKLALMIEARRLDAIRTALAVAKDEFKLNPIILGADDSFRKPELLAAGPTPTVVGPTLVREIDREIVNLPQILAGRGVPLGFQSQAGTGVKFLPEAVRYSVRYGLGVEEALKALTSGPAKFLGIDDRVGSLTPGRDADLTVLSGPPFLASTKVLAVLADGKWVFRAGAEKR